MTEITPATVDLSGAKEVTPPRAPVGSQLTGKEKAGVNLTWGVLGIIVVFLIVVIAFIWTQESSIPSGLPAPIAGVAMDTLHLRLLSAERGAFRLFWLQLVQMVLLNVLLPVLTALLGYVFGTHAASNQDAS